MGGLDPHRWTALAILLTGAFLPPLDFFIVNVALPSIREDFHSSASTMQLIISGYATTYAVMLITGGRLGDLYGRRNVFLAGMGAFAAASALCGFAWSPAALVFGRILQGFAAAIMAPQALASINAIFPEHEKSKALNLVRTVVQRVDPTQSGLASGLVNSMLQIGGALATALIGGLFFSILGSSTDVGSIGHAYSVAAVAIGLCLLVAGWLSADLGQKKEVVQ